MIIVSTSLISLGLFFLAVSAFGLLTLPDLYTRAHAVAKSETLGLLLVFGGLFFRPELDVGAAARLALVLIFSLIANPTAVHALVRAANRAGSTPYITMDQQAADQWIGNDQPATVTSTSQDGDGAGDGNGGSAADDPGAPGGGPHGSSDDRSEP